VAFTVEPGLYDEVNNIGIRIEDVVVVTEDGCEVISDGVTKVRSELTALVAEKGILDMTE
jgi:Xaa-Pro aminopeptidase